MTKVKSWTRVNEPYRVKKWDFASPCRSKVETGPSKLLHIGLFAWTSSSQQSWNHLEGPEEVWLQDVHDLAIGSLLSSW